MKLPNDHEPDWLALGAVSVAVMVVLGLMALGVWTLGRGMWP